MQVKTLYGDNEFVYTVDIQNRIITGGVFGDQLLYYRSTSMVVGDIFRLILLNGEYYELGYIFVAK